MTEATVALWVWEDPAPAAVPDGLRFIVRAANGGSTHAGAVDFAAGFASWARVVPADRLDAWTYLYPTTDGKAAAEALHGAAPAACRYYADIEERVPAAQVEEFVARLRQLAPDTPIGFTPYATRGQSIAHGVPWDACHARFDFIAPQVYFATQREQWPQIASECRGHGLEVALSPLDDVDGWAWAKQLVDAGQSISLWRYGVLDLEQAAALLPAPVPSPKPAPAPPAPKPGPSPTWSLTVQSINLAHVTSAPGTFVRGKGVHALQRLLGIKDDGVAGPQTRAALEAAQRAHRLTVDAIAGPATFTALIESL